MLKILLKNICLTTVLSFIATSILFTVYYESMHEGLEEKQSLFILFAVADVVQHLLLFIFSLPALILTKPAIRASKIQRPLFYFGGAVLVTLITLISVITNSMNDIPLLVPNVLFLAIHAVFYFRLPKP
ncbi:hypothetical protein C7475_107244 [Chitinophaga sp. S165]|nr:hypothetical protein C7475_107244 [Chitinophaga sp. S165]